MVDGAQRDDAGVGRRERGLVPGFAVVPGGGDENGALTEGVTHGRTFRGTASGGRGEASGHRTIRGQAGRIQRQRDHLGAVGGGIPDARSDRGGQALHSGRAGVQRVGSVENHPDGEDSGCGRYADDAGRVPHVVPVAGDDARHGCAFDPPGGSAGCLIRSSEIGPSDDGAAQVRMGRQHAAAEHGDGDARPARGLPRLRDVQVGQPPFLSADSAGWLPGKCPRARADAGARRSVHRGTGGRGQGGEDRGGGRQHHGQSQQRAAGQSG